MRGSKFVVFVIIVLIILYTLFQLNSYITYHDLLPPGTMVSGLSVGGLTEEQARSIVEQAYDSPVILNYADETIKLHPHRIEFRLRQGTVWTELSQQRNETPFLKGFGLFLLGEDPPPLRLEIEGRFNEQKLEQFLADVHPIHHAVEFLVEHPVACERHLDRFRFGVLPQVSFPSFLIHVQNRVGSPERV